MCPLKTSLFKPGQPHTLKRVIPRIIRPHNCHCQISRSRVPRSSGYENNWIQIQWIGESVDSRYLWMQDPMDPKISWLEIQISRVSVIKWTRIPMDRFTAPKHQMIHFHDQTWKKQGNVLLPFCRRQVSFLPSTNGASNWSPLWCLFTALKRIYNLIHCWDVWRWKWSRIRNVG